MRDRQIVTLDNAVTYEKARTIYHIDIINHEIITAINCDGRVINSRLLAESMINIARLHISDNKVLAVFDVDQLAAITAGDVRHHEVFHRLVFGVVIIVGAARKADADAPVNLAVGAVDVIDHMVGDKQVMVVDRHVPLDGVALQLAEAPVGDLDVFHAVVEALPQNAVVGVMDGDIIDREVTHSALLFSADVNLRDRHEAAHINALDGAVRPAHIKGEIVKSPALLAQDLTAVLHDKAPLAVALQAARNAQRFAFRHKNRGVDVVAHQINGHDNDICGGKSLFEGSDPVAFVELLNVYLAALAGSQNRTRESQRHRGQHRAGPKQFAA